MSTSKGSSKYNKFNWEDSEFPIICENCLGPNEYMRMIREKYGRECGVCTRPYTVFRWQTKDDKFCYTEICQICARNKYVCQCCVMDLEYSMPVALRNKIMDLENRELDANGEVNVEYQNQLIENQLKLNGDSGTRLEKSRTNVTETSIRMLTKLVKEETENHGGVLGGGDKTSICTFYMKGECGRGEKCPYRHEKPNTDEKDSDEAVLGITNGPDLKARYYGLIEEDTLSKRVLEKYSALPTLKYPENKSITTIKILGLPHTMNEKEARDYLYRFGEIRNLKRGETPGEWIVEYASRESAEKTAQLFFDWGQLGYQISAEWVDLSKLQTPKSELSSFNQPQDNFPQVPGLPVQLNRPKLLPPLPQPKNKRKGESNKPTILEKMPKILPAPPTFQETSEPSTSDSQSTIYYPSQDPDRSGNKIN